MHAYAVWISIFPYYRSSYEQQVFRVWSGKCKIREPGSRKCCKRTERRPEWDTYSWGTEEEKTSLLRSVSLTKTLLQWQLHIAPSFQSIPRKYCMDFDISPLCLLFRQQQQTQTNIPQPKDTQPTGSSGQQIFFLNVNIIHTLIYLIFYSI